jgi:hypothetical protein
MPRAKKAETPEKKKHPKGQVNTLPDGSILDLSTLPVGDIKLTDRERRFIFWYTFPGTNAFQHQTRAAVMAGYKKENAFVQGCKIRQKEHIVSAIKKIMDSKVKADLEEEYHKIIELKKRRIHYDVGEFVKIKDKEIPVGKEGDTITITVEDFKDLTELTPEQRSVIDGIDYKGPQAVRVFLFADRERAMSDIINLYQKMNGPIDENAYDFEITAEIIKEQLAFKVTARKKKEEMAETAGFMKAAGPIVEEL